MVRSTKRQRHAICVYPQEQMLRIFSKLEGELHHFQRRETYWDPGVSVKVDPTKALKIPYSLFDLLNGKGFASTSQLFNINGKPRSLSAETVMALSLSGLKSSVHSRGYMDFNSTPPTYSDTLVMPLPYRALSTQRQQLKTALKIADWNMDTVLTSTTTAIALAFAKDPQNLKRSTPATTLLCIFLMNTYLEVAVVEVTSTTCKTLAVQAVAEFPFVLKGAKPQDILTKLWATLAALDECAFNDKIQACAVVTEMYGFPRADMLNRGGRSMDWFFDAVEAKFPGTTFWSHDDLLMGAFPGMARLGLEPDLRSQVQELWPYTVHWDLFEQGGHQILVQPNDVAKDYEMTFDAVDVPTNELVIYQTLSWKSEEVAKLVRVDELKSKCPKASITVSIDVDGIIKLKVDTKSSEEYKPQLEFPRLPPGDASVVSAEKEVVAFLKNNKMF